MKEASADEGNARKRFESLACIAAEAFIQKSSARVLVF